MFQRRRSRRRVARRRRVVALSALIVIIGGGAAGVVLAHEGQAASGRPRTQPIGHLTAGPSSTGSPPDAPRVQRNITNIVALGDSIPAGLQCGCPPYPELVGRRLASAEHHAVHVNNLARPGATTSSVIAQLGQQPTRAAIGSADLVVIMVGANDLEALAGQPGCDPGPADACFRQPLSQFGKRYDTLLSELRARIRPTAGVTVAGYWNVFLDGSVARQHGREYVADSKALTIQVNTLIAWSAATHGAGYVDTYRAFRGDSDADDTALLAADGDHPNAAGQRVIAAAIERDVCAAGGCTPPAGEG